MDPIRPIGPLERDLDPVVRVTRTARDAPRERREQPDERPPRERPSQDDPPPRPPPGSDPDGPSLIDIKV